MYCLLDGKTDLPQAQGQVIVGTTEHGPTPDETDHHDQCRIVKRNRQDEHRRAKTDDIFLGVAMSHGQG